MLNKYITLEARPKKIVAGIVYAVSVEEAYEQMGESITGPACEQGTAMIVPESQANQLIIDINKMLRRKP